MLLREQAETRPRPSPGAPSAVILLQTAQMGSRSALGYSEVAPTGVEFGERPADKLPWLPCISRRAP